MERLRARAHRPVSPPGKVLRCARIPRVSTLRILLASGLAMVVAACGSAAPVHTATPPPSPTPYAVVSPFPDADTPRAGASPAQQHLWAAYEVATIPGKHTLDHVPPVPHLVNATGGVVPDDLANRWAAAFMHGSGWIQWGYGHAQGAFLGHLLAEPTNVSLLDNGATETLPDCAVYPTSLTLVEGNAGVGRPASSSQFTMVTTYTGPCTATINRADGSSQADYTFAATRVIAHQGWITNDPILGDFWYDTASNECGPQECVIQPPPVPSPGALTLPDSDTPVGSAPASLQTTWAPYQVGTIPRRGLTTRIPDAPRVTNDTEGAISESGATAIALAFMLQTVWTGWSWEHNQLDFQEHVGDASYFAASPLRSPATRGGKASIPTCAEVPSALTLELPSDDDHRAEPASHRTSLKLIASYAANCQITVSFADGQTTTVSAPSQLLIFGELRSDPYLGQIFFPESAAVPRS